MLSTALLTWPRVSACSVAALAIFYFVAARISLLVSFPDLEITAVWLPSGIAIAFAIRYGWRVLPIVFLADLAASLSYGTQLMPAIAIGFAALAEAALDDDRAVTAYAYARTGYHRGLDKLRRNGWKGFGPVPYAHEPNRGFLRCVAALARAADAIGETDEYARCLDLLDDCDPAARSQLGLS